MIKVVIEEWDNDYNRMTHSFVREFKSIEHAKQYCRDETWSGYTYIISKHQFEVEYE
jgi:hypothetical protein